MMDKLREVVRSSERGWALAGAFVGSTAVAMAQETGTEVTDFDSFLTALETNVTEALNKIWPVVAGILIVTLGFFIARLAYKYVKQFANR